MSRAGASGGMLAGDAPHPQPSGRALSERKLVLMHPFAVEKELEPTAAKKNLDKKSSLTRLRPDRICRHIDMAAVLKTFGTYCLADL